MSNANPFGVFFGHVPYGAVLPGGFIAEPTVGVLYTSVDGYRSGNGTRMLIDVKNEHVKSFLKSILNSQGRPWFRFGYIDHEAYFTTYGDIDSYFSTNGATHVKNAKLVLAWADEDRFDGQTEMPPTESNTASAVAAATGEHSDISEDEDNIVVEEHKEEREEKNDEDDTRAFIRLEGFFTTDDEREYVDEWFETVPTVNIKYTASVDDGTNGDPSGRNATIRIANSRMLATFEKILNDENEPFFRFQDPDDGDDDDGSFTTYGKVSREPSLSNSRNILRLSATPGGYKGQSLITTATTAIATATGDAVDNTLRERYTKFTPLIRSIVDDITTLKKEMDKVLTYGNKLTQMLEEQYVMPKPITSAHSALKGKYADAANKAIRKLTLPKTNEEQLLFMLKRNDHGDADNGDDDEYHGSGPLYDRIDFRRRARDFNMLYQMTRQSVLNANDASNFIADAINEKEPKHKHTKAYTDVLVNEVGNQVVDVYANIERLKKSVQYIKTLIYSRMLMMVGPNDFFDMNGFDLIGGWEGRAGVASHQYHPRYSMGSDFTRRKIRKLLLKSLFPLIEKAAHDTAKSLDVIQPDRRTRIDHHPMNFEDSDNPSPTGPRLEGGVQDENREHLTVVYSDEYPQPTSSDTPYNAFSRTYTPQTGIAYYTDTDDAIPDNIESATGMILITTSSEIEDDTTSPYHHIQDILNDDQQPFFRFSNADKLGRKARPFYTSGNITKSLNEQAYNRALAVLAQARIDFSDEKKLLWIAQHSAIDAPLTDDPILGSYKVDDTPVLNLGYNHPIPVNHATRAVSAWESRPGYNGPVVGKSYTNVATGDIIYVDSDTLKDTLRTLKTTKGINLFTFDNINNTYTVTPTTRFDNNGIMKDSADITLFNSIISTARRLGANKRREASQTEQDVVERRRRRAIEREREDEERIRRLQRSDEEEASRRLRSRSRSPSRDGSAAAVMPSGDRSRASSPVRNSSAIQSRMQSTLAAFQRYNNDDDDDEDVEGIARLSLHSAPKQQRKPQSTKVIGRYRAIVPVVTRTSRNSLLTK